MIDSKDHRRFAEGKMTEAEKAAAERLAKRALLEQAPSESANTGNDFLDKLARTVQELANQTEAYMVGVATKGIGCVPEEMFRLQQIEYFFHKGMLEAFKKVLQIPAQIIVESKPAPKEICYSTSAFVGSIISFTI